MINVDKIDTLLEGVRSVAISGHVRPDGDCVGSCLGLYHYLKVNHPELEALDMFLEETAPKFSMMEGIEQIRHCCETDRNYDLFFSLDCSEVSRHGDAAGIFSRAGRTICFDHHRSNIGMADINYIDPDMSSASELIFYAMDPDRIPLAAAEALFMGIAHDTGIFQYSNTSPQTMRTVAFLMEKGIRSSEILDRTYRSKTYTQSRILAKAILDSKPHFGGACMSSIITLSDMEQFHAIKSDLDPISSELRSISGVETSVFLYESEPHMFKVSLRSQDYLDVNKVAATFGGGGHIRAAGCSLKGNAEEILDLILKEIEKQIQTKTVVL